MTVDCYPDSGLLQRSQCWAPPRALVEIEWRPRAERRTPNALDLMRLAKIHLVIHTQRSTGGAVLDGDMMPRLAIELNILFVTTKGMPEPRLLELSSL